MIPQTINSAKDMVSDDPQNWLTRKCVSNRFSWIRREKSFVPMTEKLKCPFDWQYRRKPVFVLENILKKLMKCVHAFITTTQILKINPRRSMLKNNFQRKCEYYGMAVCYVELLITFLKTKCVERRRNLAIQIAFLQDNTPTGKKSLGTLQEIG